MRLWEHEVVGAWGCGSTGLWEHEVVEEWGCSAEKKHGNGGKKHGNFPPLRINFVCAWKSI
jgi:hypothetical protein